LIRLWMDAGAMGLSTGLAYVPGTYSKTDEIIELASVVAEYVGGFYATHMRNENNDVQEAIVEALTIAQDGGLPLEISHFKVTGVINWGKSDAMLTEVKTARQGGVDVMHDQYPYTASNGNIGLLFQDWALAGGNTAVLNRLQNPASHATIHGELVTKINDLFNGDSGLIFVSSSSVPGVAGRTIKQISEDSAWWNGTPSFDAAETIIEIVIRAGGAYTGTNCIYHSMSVYDVENIMKNDYTMIASDGSSMSNNNSPVAHPRNFGTFPRVLGYYCRDRQPPLLSLQDAVRKMTSLPALRLGFTNRGRIIEGYVADIVIFDKDVVKDQNDFENPYSDPDGYPQGIDYVLVKGVLTINNIDTAYISTHGDTGARAGKLLLRGQQ
ncbi:MAG: amidohydrolase family protein, partial [Pseudomonadota bacterium]